MNMFNGVKHFCLLFARSLVRPSCEASWLAFSSFFLFSVGLRGRKVSFRSTSSQRQIQIYFLQMVIVIDLRCIVQRSIAEREERKVKKAPESWRRKFQITFMAASLRQRICLLMFRLTSAEAETAFDGEWCRWKFHEICIFPLCSWLRSVARLLLPPPVFRAQLVDCRQTTRRREERMKSKGKRKTVRRKFKSRFLSTRCYSASLERESIKESFAGFSLKAPLNDFVVCRRNISPPSTQHTRNWIICWI